jgi:hypothetical protein
MPDVNFTYEVFLSYAHTDRLWAQRVHDSLRATNPRSAIFFDSGSLRAGDDWETQIATALDNSRSLIVLWSDEAKASDWVSREQYSFLALAKPKDNPLRRLIVLNLQGTNRAFAAFQQIADPQLLGMYSGATPFTPPVWQEIAAEISDGLNPLRKPVSVPLVALTLTVDEFDGLPAGQKNRIYTELNLDDDFLRQRYGATREDWKPYGRAESIADLVTNLQNTVNGALSTLRLAFKRPGDSFWSDIQAARQFVREEFNTSGLSVLIIDPVAIYNGDIFQRLMLFHDSLADDRRVIVTLPPFDIHGQLIQLRAALSNRATPYFDDYFYPMVPPVRRLSAQCAWNVADSDEIKRYILMAAGSLATPQSGEGNSPFVRYGSGK